MFQGLNCLYLALCGPEITEAEPPKSQPVAGVWLVEASHAAVHQPAAADTTICGLYTTMCVCPPVCLSMCACIGIHKCLYVCLSSVGVSESVGVSVGACLSFSVSEAVRLLMQMACSMTHCISHESPRRHTSLFWMTNLMTAQHTKVMDQIAKNSSSTQYIEPK